jgi:predicted Fe-S protein YdhL (DUF1289 family)
MITPCIKVCKLNAERQCIGCGRTLDEIARWTQMTDGERQEILYRLQSENSTEATGTLLPIARPIKQK